MGRLTYKSFYRTILLFWVFSTFPRISYLWAEGLYKENILLLLKIVVCGFLQDGVLVGGLLLVFLYLHKRIYKLNKKAVDFVHYFLIAILAIFLLLMMANTEFLRLFGSNSNLTHLSFLSQSDILIPSLKVVFPPKKLIFSILLVPVLFFILSTIGSSWAIGLFFKEKKAYVFSLLIFVLGLLATFTKSETKTKFGFLDDNYILSFLTYSLLGDEIHGKATEPIEKILSHTIDSNWVHFDPKFPLIKATPHHLCQLGIWKGPVCEVDGDGDGAPLGTDCNDANPSIYPGARDIPGNGIDEDCSGLDANPPNIILIHWEGARSVNIGSIGYSDPVTPRFDALSKKGKLFVNAYANGTQTRWSLISVYCSILPRLSTKWIFKHNPDLNLLAFPQILRERGYQTIYVHSGDINFGNLKRRVSIWFEKLFDRTNQPIKKMARLGWGIRDKELYEFTYNLLTESTDSRPFFMTIATLSLHHPFYMPDEKYQLYPHSSEENKYKNILHYADEQLGAFVEKVLNTPKFQNTLVIIAADHGMNVGAPHKTWSQSTLWEDLVWVPILLVGKNWNVPPGMNTDIHQLADIGPTILDRLGIEVPNHFIGRSLLKNYPNGESGVAFFGNANGGLSAGMRKGSHKFIHYFGRNQPMLFDMNTDRKELNNLCSEKSYESLCEKYSQEILDVYIQNTKLINDNKIWDWRYWKK